MPHPRLQASLAAFVTAGLWYWKPGYITAVFALSAAGLALLAWISPAAYAPFARAFHRFGHAILLLFTWCILGLVFFGLLLPLRLWRAIRRQDPLQRRHATSYLHALPQTPPDFTRQF